MTGSRNKRIFISDIHMGDKRSTIIPSPNPPYSYGWLKKNISTLAQFLEAQLKAPDVAEVVILGDIFDDWVIPTSYDPLIAFNAICSNPDNQPVISNLKALADCPDIALSYVPGNHDMAMNAAGIPATRQFLQEIFPGIKYLCDGSLPVGVYRAGRLAAEHGDRYCLFNAPDTWTAKDAFLPLGYFIARMVAYKVLNGKPEDYLSILRRFAGDSYQRIIDFETNVIEDFIYAVAEYAGLGPDDSIKVKGVPGYGADVSVAGIAERFEHLLANWIKSPGNISLPIAIAGDVGHLSPAADFAYFFPSNTNIVIFGHTHIADMKKHYILAEAPDLGEVRLDIPCRAIYANSGAWVDSVKFCTYVETEEDPAAKRHYVRVKTYPGSTILKEGYVKL